MKGSGEGCAGGHEGLLSVRQLGEAGDMKAKKDSVRETGHKKMTAPGQRGKQAVTIPRHRTGSRKGGAGHLSFPGAVSAE